VLYLAESKRLLDEKYQKALAQLEARPIIGMLVLVLVASLLANISACAHSIAGTHAEDVEVKYKQALEQVASLTAELRVTQVALADSKASEAQRQLEVDKLQWRVTELDDERTLLQGELARRRMEIKDYQEQLLTAKEAAVAEAPMEVVKSSVSAVEAAEIEARRQYEIGALRQLQATLSNLKLLFGVTNTAINDTNAQVALLLENMPTPKVAAAVAVPPASADAGTSTTTAAPSAMTEETSEPLASNDPTNHSEPSSAVPRE